MRLTIFLIGCCISFYFAGVLMLIMLINMFGNNLAKEIWYFFVLPKTEWYGMAFSHFLLLAGFGIMILGVTLQQKPKEAKQ